jgi:hypothetical protein
MDIANYLETYDTVISILDTVKYGCRALTTKRQLLKALNDTVEVTAGFAEIRTIRFHIDALLFSVKPVEELPEGTVTDEVKNCITDGMRAVHRAIAVAFYSEYYEHDIGEYAEQCPGLLRKLVADVMLGDYRLGGAAA